MKTAVFTFKARRNTAYATVTLKDDGKISVSINNPKMYSSAERYQIKNAGIAIVKADFNDPAVQSLTESDDKLIEALRVNTTDLKADYITWTKKYAKNYFKFVMSLKDWTKEQWLDKYGVTIERETYENHPVTRQLVRVKKPVVVLNRTGESYQSDLYTFQKIGFKKYEAKEVELAERHYNDSLRKLASRLNQKGVTADSAWTISRARVGVNLEMTIHHGDMITRAWTIVAAQDSQLMRPHYRYLVK
jgi:hypothetical protein